MRVDVPFLYSAHVVAPRQRRHRVVSVLGRERFEIPEFSAREAPVVARMAWNPRVRGEVLPARGAAYRLLPGAAVPGLCAKPLEVEFHADDRWRHAPWDPVPADRLRPLLDAWARGVVEPGGAGLAIFDAPFQAASRAWHAAPVLQEGHRGRERWLWHDRDLVLERLRAAMRGAAVVDGLVHAASRGPCWHVELRSDWERGAPFPRQIALVRACGELAGAREGNGRLFEAGAGEDAAREARRIAGQMGHVDVPVQVRGRVEVVRPDLFEQSLLGPRAVEAAGVLLDSVGGALPAMEAESIRLYAEIKLALRGAEKIDAPHAAFEDLAAMAADLHATWLRGNGGAPPRGKEDPMPRFFERTGIAPPVAPWAAPDRDGAVRFTPEDLADLGQTAPGMRR